jgi:hypothetical protein
MKELLKKWRELAASECALTLDLKRKQVFNITVAGREFNVTILDGDVYMPTATLPLLQAAVQEAIEARAWHWQTFYFPEATGDKHRAAVDGFNTPTYEPLKEFAAPSAAEALLSAYLTALEAQG